MVETMTGGGSAPQSQRPGTLPRLLIPSPRITTAVLSLPGTILSSPELRYRVPDGSLTLAQVFAAGGGIVLSGLQFSSDPGLMVCLVIELVERPDSL
jgi:hypothetical protein